MKRDRHETDADEPFEDARAEATEATATDVDRLARERDEYLAQWQRAQADYQNLRRRHMAEIEANRRRSLQPLLESLLLVLDNLDMALSAERTSEESQNLARGIQLTRDQFVRALEQEGVRPVETEGSFDPSVHEAVASVPADQPPGTIVQVLRPGYTWGDTVLRPAQVHVAAEPREER